jgi:hypothetical protein
LNIVYTVTGVSGDFMNFLSQCLQVQNKDFV